MNRYLGLVESDKPPLFGSEFKWEYKTRRIKERAWSWNPIVNLKGRLWESFECKPERGIWLIIERATNSYTFAGFGEVKLWDVEIHNRSGLVLKEEKLAHSGEDLYSYIIRRYTDYLDE